MFDQPSAQCLAGLQEFLRIPSVSADPLRVADCRRAAEFVRGQLDRARLDNVRLIAGDGLDLVYGEWLGAPGKPTVLFYGHYDVQPAEPLDEWYSPPFEPTVREGNIYARGASDDKGQVYLVLQALSDMMAEHGRLPVNVKVIIEGEEESGGTVLERYVHECGEALRADMALVCDTEMFAAGLPTICVGLRGIVYGEIHVQASAQDLHSGVYGGVAPNAVQAAAEIVAALKSRDGKLLIPGIYDDVAEPTPAERQTWARLPFNEDEYRRGEVNAPLLTGEPDIPVLERVWARPTFEVHGIRGGFTGEGAKTVIPARAVAKVSLRLVPRQEPQRVIGLVQQAVAAVCPTGVTARFAHLHTSPPVLVSVNNAYVQTAMQALREVWGREAVTMRSGGSIPVVTLFAERLRLPTVLMGFGLPDDNLHAPNEKFSLSNLTGGMKTVRRYLEMLGDTPASPST